MSKRKLEQILELVEEEEEDDDENEDEGEDEELNDVDEKKKKKKKRVLVVGSRGINAISRHLMNDLRKLLPHSKRDCKVDVKKNLYEINEIAEMKNCDYCLFFETKRNSGETFLWTSQSPHGPSAKFLVSNPFTSSELKLTGNCLLGSRPLLVFDKNFERNDKPELNVVRDLFENIFGTPEYHRSSKPFIDHAFFFFYADDRIWFRHYQIVVDSNAKGKKNRHEIKQLAEIGPRFVLQPVRVFEGSFGGPTIFKNPKYLTPSAQRRAERMSEVLEKKQRTARKESKKRKLDSKVNDNEDVDQIFQASKT